MIVTRRRLGIGVLLVLVAYGALATRVEERALRAQSAGIQPGNPATARISAAELMRDVRALTAPEMQGRRTGTEGGRRARDLIRGAFERIGLEPAGTSGYDQPFRFVHSSIKGFFLPGRPWKTSYEGTNLLGRVAGTDAAAKTIVLSAHYDHLGVQDGAVYPGADDNASGVAALLAIARVVHAQRLRHPVIVAAFDAEELGLRGADAFLASAGVSSIALDINFDMVSRNDRNEIFAAGTYHYPWLMPILEEVRQRSAVKLLFGHDRPMSKAGMIEDWSLQSDHGVFHKAGIPFAYFGVEDHPDYHHPTDTADRIDASFFANVVNMLLDAVVTLDARVP